MATEQTTSLEEQVPAGMGVAGGIVVAALGVLAILFPFVTGVALSLLLGALLVVGALIHVAAAFTAGSLGSAVWQVVLALLYGFAGITFMANPVVGLASLTILVIAFFVVDGVVEIAWALTGRGEGGWVWLLVSGGISLLLATMLWVGFPSTAAWAVGLLFGVNLLVTGLAMIVYGRRGGRAEVTEASSITGG